MKIKLNSQSNKMFWTKSILIHRWIKWTLCGEQQCPESAYNQIFLLNQAKSFVHTSLLLVLCLSFLFFFSFCPLSPSFCLFFPLPFLFPRRDRKSLLLICHLIYVIKNIDSGCFWRAWQVKLRSHFSCNTSGQITDPCTTDEHKEGEVQMESSRQTAVDIIKRALIFIRLAIICLLYRIIVTVKDSTRISGEE